MQNSLSDLYARPAIDYFEGKRSEAYTVTQAEWQAIENNVVQADKMMPGNPRYLEILGLLQQLKLTVFDDELSIDVPAGIWVTMPRSVLVSVTAPSRASMTVEVRESGSFATVGTSEALFW